MARWGSEEEFTECLMNERSSLVPQVDFDRHMKSRQMTTLLAFKLAGKHAEKRYPVDEIQYQLEHCGLELFRQFRDDKITLN